MASSTSFKLSIDPEKVAARRAIFFSLVVLAVFIAVQLFLRAWASTELTWLEIAIATLFTLLLAHVATGGIMSLLGFIQHLRGGDPFQITRLPTRENPNIPRGATAIVMPIYNEDADRVFAAIEAMWKDLQATRKSEGFDFFILSDSNRPESWVREEWAWASLCRKLDGFGRIFYRKRRIQTHGKAGNLADFCRRWGRRYRYMIVLDADSVMTGKCMSRLVDTMETHPQVGLIQTMPWMVLGVSPFRRAFQFVLRLCGPLFAAGANFWQLFGASYWGHNAIIRVQAFIEHCDLPDLPEHDTSKRHILSHDTIEAALMRKAGYEVWVASEIDGSYEEGPPNLTDMLKRDRRWCQGNLQHFWFLFAPGINFANRMHILFGILAYAGSPLWLSFLILSAIDGFYKYRIAWYSAVPNQAFSGIPVSPAVLLLALTLGLLFVPKLMGWLVALPRAREYGGLLPLTFSVLLETVLSAILAPIIMLFHTLFVLTAMSGAKVTWGSQNRKDNGGLAFGDCVKQYGWVSALGVLAGIGCWIHLPPYFAWFSPIFVAWFLAVPVAWLSSREALGRRLQNLHLFQIPEETSPHPVLLELEKTCVDDFARQGLSSVVEHPLVHALHVSLLRERTRKNPSGPLAFLTERAIQNGIESLSLKEQMRLLWDPAALVRLHEARWLEAKKEAC